MIKLIIFDLDGTLVNAYKAIKISLNFTLKKLGYRSIGAYAVRRSIGRGDKNFIKKFVKEEDVIRALKIYRQHHKTSLLEYSKIIPQAKGVLDALKKKGYRLAIVSNRPARFTYILLRHLGLRGYFDMVACGKGKEDLKPSPKLLHRVMKGLGVAREETLYVGDMAIDVLAGRNALVKTIAITGGSSSKTELKKAGPFKIITKLKDLLNKTE